MHDYLHMMNEATFGSDDSFMTVGEMSSTTIDNCVLYSAPERHELSMAFNFHHLKVDYEDGQKWTIAPFDFEELKRLYHTWGKEMSDRGGWSALFWNNHDQPRALNRFVDIKNFRNEGATMLAASIHLSRGTPYIYMGEEIGMIDPDYDSMADYVDVESMLTKCSWTKVSLLSKLSRLSKLSHVIIPVRQCNGMLLIMQVFQ